MSRLLLLTLASAFLTLASAFKSPGSVPGPVLVVGATGKTGRLVCERLSRDGIETRALARSPRGEAAQALGELPGVSIVNGDILDESSLRRAMSGCSGVISVAGTVRPVALSDLLTLSVFSLAEKPDPRHPQRVNFQGTANLLAAMKETGVRKIVRLTGLSCGFSAFNPFALLFGCLLLSMSTMWHSRAENLLRSDTAIDYTILRPGGLRDTPRGEQTLTAASCTLPKLAGIGREDLAALAVECMISGAASRATVACGWAAPGEGSSDWGALLASIPADAGLLPLKRYRLAVGVLLVGLLTAAWASVTALIRAILFFWSRGGLLGVLGL